uniref:G-type lectin S-receptor-like serine/threonine-protein kinase At4g27290 isoform X2 n=1 Tax=Erigeron canadensis TaxID=72917 RepID=UPI001CB8DA9B|nr:G-type lectin S-receptor-like serine/threonine-protein kinase At4g27290 isoform X2 [Erigeron canadensis]
MEKLIILVFLCFGTLCFMLTCCNAVDTFYPNEPIRDGDTIVSTNGLFEMGFFSPGNSKNRYLGIWYKKVSNGTVVWVANRDTPVNSTSAVLQVSSGRILQLIVDGMKLGKDLITGIERYTVSWKSNDDPSRGQYVAFLDTNGFPQIFDRRGEVLQTRIGPWNGVRFSGMPSLTSNPTSVNVFVVNEKEMYYRFEVEDLVVSRIYVNPDGVMTRMNWVNATQSWFSLTSPPTDSCARYGLCGPYGICNTNNFPVCSCMEGFNQKRPEEWSLENWSSGCVRRTRLGCVNGDGFKRISGVKVPDTRTSRYNYSMTLGDCEMACRMNCSCTAYANLDIRNGGSGCLLWFNELMDMREHNGETQSLYIRMAASELPSLPIAHSGSGKKKQIIIAIFSTLVAVVLVIVGLAMYARSKKMKRLVKDLNDNSTNDGREEVADLQSFCLSKIAKSTNNFSVTNKIGEGGFGLVYKGVLDDGREIAVKRLSETSRQGIDEFKNEVRCIAKLQHRNLVKLLGYCIQGHETMLIYEYMANKSLDLTIFDETQSSMLDWSKRFCIIHGIARGLLYLHQDSRLRVIHRDLKAANILLDDDMNPKISDFGLARRFKGYETEANTNKVVGTYGYISPEYAVHGHFSVKSDVFSFGVLVLEIVSGKKNQGFVREEHSDNLLGHAWRLYNEDRSIELACSDLRDKCNKSELLRSIHIGLLCVQHHAEDRPTMSSVVVMLDNESTLPPPKQPAFFTEAGLFNNNTQSLGPTQSSVNVTMTLLDAR